MKPTTMMSSIVLETKPATIDTPISPFHNITLPPEIWLLVFPNLKTLDLQSVSTTCTTFRYMAQPFLFSVLDVSPFLLSYNADQPILRPQTYLHRFLARLEYYKQPHIAHGVHHCWVSPYSRSGFAARSPNDDLDPNLIIDALVEAMPSFTNLSTLSWHCIDISPQWWTIIQTLHLKRIWLNSSSITAPIRNPPLGIVHLDLDHWPWEGRVTNHVSILEERTNGVDETTLQQVINLETVQSISVPRPDTAIRLFAVVSKTASQLRVLKIPFSSISHPTFILALQCCSFLDVLCIFPPSSDSRASDFMLNNVPTSTLPLLVNYEGPYTHVMELCRHPLKRVSLWGFDGRPALCDAEAVAETLLALADTESVVSLKSIKLSVVNITHELLEALGEFKQVESVSIQSQDNESDFPANLLGKRSSQINALYSMLGTVSIPSTLKRLKLSTRLGGDNLEMSAQEHQAALFMEAFAGQHSNTQQIEISYGIYWTGMYTAKWGRIRGNDDRIPTGTQVESFQRSDGDEGYSSKSSSKDYVLSTVVSTVHPLPLGKLTFTEHRRMILFQPGSSHAPLSHQGLGGPSERRLWMIVWMRLRRFFGKSDG